MKRVFVTGGGGFVGLALVRRLTSLGVSVVAMGRRPSPAVEACGATMLCGDIRDADFLISASKGCDTLFHVAAKAGIWGPYEHYYSINVTGTENVLFAALKNRISRLVYTSTPSVVFNGSDIVNGQASLPYAKQFSCHYATTKCIAEKRVLHANSPSLQTVALRPHLIWGPGDTNLIPRLVAWGRKGVLKQVGEGCNQVDIAYIDNVVDAHLLAAKALDVNGLSAGKAYFISQGEPVNLWQWINELFSRLEIAPVQRKISYKKAFWAGAILEALYTLLGREDEPLMTRFLAGQLAHSHWFSMAEAQRDFGYTPQVSTQEGMGRLIHWLREEGL